MAHRSLTPMSEQKQKAFCADHGALVAAFRKVQSELARIGVTGSGGGDQGIIESGWCVEDTGEGQFLVEVDGAVASVDENEPFSEGFYRRYMRVHYLLVPARYASEGGPVPRVADAVAGGISLGFMEETLLFAFIDGLTGGGVDLDELTAAVETLREEIAKLRKWKESAGRNARRFGT